MSTKLFQIFYLLLNLELVLYGHKKLWPPAGSVAASRVAGFSSSVEIASSLQTEARKSEEVSVLTPDSFNTVPTS